MVTKVPAVMTAADVAKDAEVVHLTGNETIQGTKSFSTQPVLPQKITLGTAVPTTSGTSIDFTGIPNWVKRITVILNLVSTNGASIPQVQIGSGSFDTTGYNSVASTTGTGVATATSTTGIIVHGGGAGGAAATVSGHLVLTHVGSNVWTASFIGAAGTAGTACCIGGAAKTLAGVLDRVRLTTVNGTDVFDAGVANILYE